MQKNDKLKMPVGTTNTLAFSLQSKKNSFQLHEWSFFCFNSLAFKIGITLLLFITIFPTVVSSQELKTDTKIITPNLEFQQYDDLIEYTEDINTKTVFYKYKTDIVPQKTEDNWNEDLTKRESNKEYYFNPITNERKVKIYSGENFIKVDNEWRFIEYATTTEDIFFDELEKTVPIESLFDKMISFVNFFPAIAQTSSSTYSNINDGSHRSDEGSFYQAATTGTANTVNTTQCNVYSLSGAQKQVSRCQLPFNSNIGSGYNVNSASIFLFVSSILDYNSTYDYNVIVDFEGGESDLVVADFSEYSSTELSSQITLDNHTASSYEEFELNATGINNINLEGYSNFGVRNGHDLEETDTGLNTYSGVYYQVIEDGTSERPYLEIYYSEVTSTSTSSFSIPCDIEYNTDISIVSACEEQYLDGSATPTRTTYTYYYSSFIQYLYIFSLLSFLLFICLLFILKEKVVKIKYRKRKNDF